MEKKYSNGWTALATPFNGDYTVSWEQLRNNVEFQTGQGIHGLLPMGTTGESPSVTHEEHPKIIEKTVEYAGAKSLVLAGTGSNSTDEAIFETQKAVEAGVDACLLVDCYYNKPSSIELRNEYYSPILSAFPETDFITYSIPGRSVTVTLPEDIAILRSEHPNLAAVKEASGDFDRMKRIRELVDEDFIILSGDDPNTLKMMDDKKITAKGVISVISNICPASVEKLTQHMLAGEKDKAAKIDSELKPLFGIVGLSAKENLMLPNGQSATVTYKFPNPLPVKTMMNGLGMITALCKRPHGRMTKSGVETVRNALKDVWAKTPQHLSPIESHYDVDISQRLQDDRMWDRLSY
jgi:4-hydroxy-tetrahydrodipicolinate synthase